MNKITKVGVTGLAVAGALVATPTAALAKDGDVQRRGTCAGNHDFKLVVGLDNGRLDIAWELEANRGGERWRTVIRRNGQIVATSTNTTSFGPNPGFSIDRQVANPAGVDTISVVSTRINGSGVCRASVRR